MSLIADRLLERIHEGHARVGVVGLGFKLGAPQPAHAATDLPAGASDRAA